MIYIALIGLLVTFFAALGAKSFTEFSRHDLEEICRRRKSEHLVGKILASHDRISLAAETLQVVGTAITLVGLVLWISQSEIVDESGRITPTDWAFGIGLGVLLLLAAEIWFPWAIARLSATSIVYHTWPTWRALAIAVTPLVFCAQLVDTILHRLAGKAMTSGEEDAFGDEIRTIVTEGHREGLLEEDAREMIEGVIELSDVDVSEIMTPRTDMISMSASLSWDEAVAFIIEAGHSRIPVYQETRDDIIGVLVTKDLLPELAKPCDARTGDWTSVLRDPSFVPETKPVDVLLQEFQVNHHHMVIVLDEYGGVAGLVTMEDVLEEIVGDIVDEHDPVEEEEIREIDEHSLEALGRAHIDEINQRLRSDLPEEEDYDTIGGFVFSELGRVPIPGDHVVWQSRVKVSVLEATRRRVERVQVELLDANGDVR